MQTGGVELEVTTDEELACHIACVDPVIYVLGVQVSGISDNGITKESWEAETYRGVEVEKEDG